MKSKTEAYYQKLLQKYLQGTITDNERYLLEKRALDDAMLMDALEGYEKTKRKTLRDDLEVIRQKLSKNGNKPRIPLYVYSIAASLLIIFGVFWFTGHFEVSKGQDKEMIAQVSDDFTKILPPESLQEDLAKEEGLIREEETENSVAAVAAKKSLVKRELAKADNKESTPTDPIPYPSSAENMISKNTDTAPDQNESDELALLDMNYIIEGQVLNMHGEPLHLANVRLAETNTEIRTDLDGAFLLVSPLADPELNISYQDYVRVDTKALDQYFISVQLRKRLNMESNTATKLKKSLYSLADKSFDLIASDGVTAVRPEMGFTAYQNFIKIKTKQAGISVTERVIIQFRILQSGKVDEIKILDSSCESCNALVKEILKRGGHWQTNPKSQDVFVQYELLIN